MFKHVLTATIKSALLATTLLLSTPSPTRAATITVSHWGSLYYGAPFAVAMSKGYFAKHHVAIDKIAGGSGGGTTVRNAMATSLPYGEVSLAAAIEAIRAGIPIRIVNTSIDTLGDFVLITKKGGPIKTFQEIKGKKIAYSRPGSVSQMAVLLMLKALKINPSDVKMIAVGGVGAALTAINNGTVDVGFTGEPIWTKEKNNFQVVGWLRDVMDVHFTQIVGIVNEAYAKAHPATIKGILAARREAVDFIYAHPMQAADIVAKTYGQSESLVRPVFKHLATMKYWSEGKMNTSSMESMLEGLRLVGALKGSVDLKGMLDSSYLPANLK